MIGAQPGQTLMGNWTTIKGDDKDDNAVVYELNPDGPDHPQYFLKVDDATIQQLDGDGHVINAPGLNFDLKKQ